MDCLTSAHLCNLESAFIEQDSLRCSRALFHRHVTTAGQSATPLKLKDTIALEGVEGRIDHFAFDAAGERLFICALGNNTVEALDLRKGERIHSITGLGSPQGIAYIPHLDRLFVANDKGGVLKIYDGKSFQLLGELNFKDDADNLRYDEATKKIYIGFGSGGIGIVNAPKEKKSGQSNFRHIPKHSSWKKMGAEFLSTFQILVMWR